MSMIWLFSLPWYLFCLALASKIQEPLAVSSLGGTAKDMAHLPNGSSLEQHLHTHVRPRVATLHHGLIDGLFTIYEIFVAMQFLADSEISWPPHANFPSHVWLDAGFEPEVIDLLSKLPYSTKRGEEVPIENTCTNVYPYLSGGGRHDARYPYFVEDYVLEPWEFAITETGVSGDPYVYNGRDGTISIWRSYFNGKITKLDGRPASDVLSELIENFKSLKWIVWPDHVGFIDFHEPSLARLAEFRSDVETDHWPQLKEWSPVARAKIIRMLRNDKNEQYSKKKLFIDHGWPDHFDGEGFRAAKEGWEKRKLDLYGAASNFGPVFEKMLAQGVIQIGMADWEMEGLMEASDLMKDDVERYTAFLAESAGEFAV